jgi:class 3 adenylate cyclase/tetratricopeptide (TPR) repeat protein
MEPVPCHLCGFVNLTGEDFCGECGVSVSATAAPGPRRPVQIERAERRHLTVMFCDMVGSTALSGVLDAEELREVLTAFQDACREQIERFDGFIARYMGDGMLVYFGFPTAHEDDAERAVRAGLALVDAVGALDSLEVQPRVRVGIASGEAVVGDLIGKGASEEAAVIGETPNLAARLQGLAEPGTVVLSDSTYRLCRGAAEVADLGRHPLKGFAEPVQAWRAIRTMDRRKASTVLPLVGREFEKALLGGRWATAQTGNGQVVLLGGGPGTGKSRLLASLDATAGEWVLQCSRHHRHTPLFPWSGAVRAAAGIAFGEANAARTEKLESWVHTWSDAPGDLPGLAALLGVEGPWGALEGTPAEQKHAVLAALERQVERGLQAGPFRLIVEDAQWADATTSDLVSRLVARAASSALFVIITHRPDAQIPWKSGGHVTALSLSGLPPLTAAQFARTVAGATTLPDQVVDRIVARGDGVPAYIEELTRAVLGAAGASGDLNGVRVPDTLQDSLMAQLDLLGSERVIAQAAAVLGRSFDGSLLARLLEHPPASVEGSLERLGATGLIGKVGPDRYSFRHALVRDVAYGSLLNKAKVRLHCRVADLLLEGFGDSPEADPELVARHLAEAQRGGEAGGWWVRAAERAASRGAVDDAVTAFEHSLDLLEADVEDDDGSDDLAGQERRVRVRTRLALQLRLRSEWARAMALLDEAIAIATAHGLLEARSSAHFAMGNLHFGEGDFESCAAAHMRGLADAEACGSEAGQVQALGGLGDAYLSLGRFDEARDVLRRCVEGADALGLTDIAAAYAPMRVWIELWELDLSTAWALAREGVERAETSTTRARAIAHYLMVAVAVQAGDLAKLERHFAVFNQYSHGVGGMGLRLRLLAELGLAASRGEVEPGARLVEEAFTTWAAGDSWRGLSVAALGFVEDRRYPEMLEDAVGKLASGPSHSALQLLHLGLWGCARRRDVVGLGRLVAGSRGHRACDCALRDLWCDVGDAVAAMLSHDDDAPEREAAVRARGARVGLGRVATLLDDVHAWAEADHARSRAHPA